jgi:YkoY family integral membrane protein
MFSFTLSDVPLILWYIGVLTFLEGLLSADNALVLALMVRHLPRREQRRVLVYGIWGAIGFRIVAVMLSAVLLTFWFVKVFGGAYLLYLAISHFLFSREAEDPAEASSGRSGSGSRRWRRSFWGTVIAITGADIAFSIDSILAAVAMADDFPARFGYNGKVFIVVTGGVLGIITMRFVVRYFLILLDRFPGLAEGAYLLVAWIGLKLALSGLHDASFLSFHIPEWLFWSVMVLIAVVSLVIKPRVNPSGGTDASHGLDLLESEEEPTDDGNRDGTVGPRGPEPEGAANVDPLGDAPGRNAPTPAELHDPPP